MRHGPTRRQSGPLIESTYSMAYEGTMAQAQSIEPATAGGFGATERRDTWWIGPLATAIGLGGFVIYATFRAFYNADYQLGVGTGILPDHAYLLSPFFSPLIVLPWLPAWI